MTVDQILTDSLRIEGMTSPPSARIFHSLLSNQSLRGPLLEIGAYKGQSAYVIAACARANEAVYAMDPEDRIDWKVFGDLKQRVTFLEGYSENLQKLLPGYESLKGKFRFIHDDAAHTFDNVLANMRHADFLLAPTGFVAVDDYENPNYPQVPFAVAAAIFRDLCDLRPVLVANNKAYFCREAYWKDAMHFVRWTLAKDLKEFAGFSLARTDASAFAPYCLRLPNVSDEDGLYAPRLYKHFLTDWLG